MPSLSRDAFVGVVQAARAEHPGARLAVPVAEAILSDQLTPVLAYRRLVSADERLATSFLLESVEGGQRQGRHSILAADPAIEVLAFHDQVQIIDHRAGTRREFEEADPLRVPRRLTADLTLIRQGAALPDCMLGGWVGFAAYDTVRYAEPEKLNPAGAPPDDRNLPDLAFAYYDRVIVFDSVDKLAHVVRIVEIAPGDDPAQAYDRALADLDDILRAVQTHSRPLPAGRVSDLRAPAAAPTSNLTRQQHRDMVRRAKEYIRAGDIFQVVLGQRFERISPADPFDVYRALRAVNPSPYMVYLQAPGCILVASSPEILCRVRRDPQSGERTLTNRPLAGTRKRGATPQEDRRLERELLADEKERAEHIMLVDLGRNDVGKVAKPGRVSLDAVMEIERYSHVMHISSTITAPLRDDLDCWDALRATLPVGTISGAPKVRAMQIIDELEPVRRGPYGGGMGYVTLDGDMDIALALRTMVVPTDRFDGAAWTYHLQAAGGVVSDSQPDAEYDETVNKAAALARSIELAQRAFTDHGD